MSSVLVGNRRIQIEDIGHVALNNYAVILDTAVFEHIHTDTKKNKPIQVTVQEKNFESYLPNEIVRAIMFVKVIALMHGRSGIHADTILFYTQLLNNNITPKLPNVLEAKVILEYLAYAAFGYGFCHTLTDDNIPLADALKGPKLEIPMLSTLEFETFKSGTNVSTAIAALAIYRGKLLVDLADVVAALSCDALLAFSEPFQTAHFDMSRPHKSQIFVASNLRMYLEDSKCVNSRKEKVDIQDSVSIRCIPQIHGPARESTNTGSNIVTIELNSAESEPHSTTSKSAGEYHPQVITTAITGVQRALASLAIVSQRRVLHLLSESIQYQVPKSEALYPLFHSEDIASKWTKVIDKLNEISEKSIGTLDCIPDDIFEIKTLDVVAAKGTYDIVFVLQNILVVETLAALQLIRIREQEIDQKQQQKQQNQNQNQKQKQTKTGDTVDSKAEKQENEGSSKKDKKKEKKDKKNSLQIGKPLQKFRDQLPAITESIVTVDSLKNLFEQLRHLFDASNQKFRDWFLEFITPANVTIKPQPPKGTLDYHPDQMSIREKVFRIIGDVFKRHGAVTIETPVFELKETLTGKYGEDSKLIYDLADQGGEMLSLRYDLTVPFARYLATYGIENFKRFHIARVYRRDNPVLSKGRFREFYQCDFDIAGSYGKMIPDSEVLKLVTEILDELKIGAYVIKLNHRKLLDGVLDLCGVKKEKFRTICSSIDKLDKTPWDQVRAEMIDEKGISAESADKIGTFVKLNGPPNELLKTLKEKKMFTGHTQSNEALDELELLFNYLECFGVTKKFIFDLSLARGLDYYTGLIYEAVLTDSNLLGSIGGGGRYDNLVGMFSGKQIPAVGVSIGIERIFAILEKQEKERGTVRHRETEVYVVSVGKNMLTHRMKLCNELWAHGIKAEFFYMENPKFPKQFEYVDDNKIPIALIIGEDEIKNNIVQVKNMYRWTQAPIAREKLIETIKRELEIAFSGPPLPKPASETKEKDADK